MAVLTESTRITVLISGSGTNLQALIDALPTDLASAKIVRVISNRKGVVGLQRAEKAGIETKYHNIVRFKKENPGNEKLARELYDTELAQLILEVKSDLVVCAGFMHILSSEFLDPLQKEGVDVINLHPAKYGQYDGKDAIERAHQDFVDGKINETGVMIHYVIKEVDRGEPLVQVPVPLSHPADDDIESLKERIHQIEHKAIVQGTQLAIGKLSEKESSA